MELAWITNVLEVDSNTANSVTVRNSTANDIVLANNVNFELNSQNGARSAVGTVPVGQTITPNQTVTLTVSGTPLGVNVFSMGRMFITPLLRSLTVTANTTSTVDVTNNGTSAVVIADATYFRLYDDDDYDNQSPTNVGSALNGDENEDIPEPNMDLLQPNDIACVVNPVNGQITNNCNVLMSAYIRPADNLLDGSHDNISYSANSPDADILNIYNLHFRNIATEIIVNFGPFIC